MESKTSEPYQSYELVAGKEKFNILKNRTPRLLLCRSTYDGRYAMRLFVPLAGWSLGIMDTLSMSNIELPELNVSAFVMFTRFTAPVIAYIPNRRMTAR